MVDRTGSLTLLCALIAILAILTNSAEPERSKGGQFNWTRGPFRLTVDYDATSDEGKLNLEKVMVRTSFGFGEKVDILLSEAILSEDLVRCKNSLKDTPEIESLIACKTLKEHLVEEDLTSSSSFDHSVSHMKRLSIRISRDHNSIFLPEFNQEHHFHPLEPEHTRLMIDSILAKQNLTRSDLAFSSMSTESGFFVKSELSAGMIRLKCTANLFLIANQTKLMQPNEPLDGGFGKKIPKFARLYEQFKENGGFISVHDASCEPSIAIGSLNSDFTFIYRKQFPFVSLEYEMKTSPFESLLHVHGRIDQVRNQSLPEAYNTSVQFESTSILSDALNFKINQDFTNLDFVAGSEHMLIIHPLQSFVMEGHWNASSVFQVLRIHQTRDVIDFIKGLTNELADSIMLLLYNDKPDMSKVTLTLAVERNILYKFFEKLGLITKHKTGSPNYYVVSADSLTPELRRSLSELVDRVMRDEL